MLLQTFVPIPEDVMIKTYGDVFNVIRQYFPELAPRGVKEGDPIGVADLEGFISSLECHQDDMQKVIGILKASLEHRQAEDARLSPSPTLRLRRPKPPTPRVKVHGEPVIRVCHSRSVR